MYRLLTQACAHHNSRFRDKTHWKQSPIKQLQPCFSAVNLTQNFGRDNAQCCLIAFSPCSIFFILLGYFCIERSDRCKKVPKIDPCQVTHKWPLWQKVPKKEWHHKSKNCHTAINGSRTGSICVIIHICLIVNMISWMLTTMSMPVTVAVPVAMPISCTVSSIASIPMPVPISRSGQGAQAVSDQHSPYSSGGGGPYYPPSAVSRGASGVGWWGTVMSSASSPARATGAATAPSSASSAPEAPAPTRLDHRKHHHQE